MTGTVILVDVSGSMGLPVGPRRRIDVLESILAHILPAAPDARVFAFRSIVTVLETTVKSVRLPTPEGSTALHLALEHVAPFHPRRVVVISDGEPDDRQAAIHAARALGCIIDTFHAGDESDRAAIGFLRTLALCGRGGVGRARLADLGKPETLAGELRLLLAGPAR